MGSFLVGPKIPVIDEQADGSYYGVNMRQFLRMAQALIQANVINLTTANPPADPANGDTYIVASAATGAWAGQTNHIAYWTVDNPIFPGGVWEFWTPKAGWIAGNLADESAYIFNGTIWVKIGATTGFGGSGAYFFGPGISNLASIFSLIGGAVGAGSANGVIAANVVTVYLFELFEQWTISKATTESVGSLGGVTATFGIYDAALNKVVDAGQFSCLASAGVQTNAFTPVTVDPGLYWHAQATTSVNNPAFPGLIVGAGGQTPSIMAFLTKNAVRVATAANPLVAGVLPATLGALTGFTPSNFNGDGIVCPLWE